MNKLQIADNIVDICSKHQLESVLAPLTWFFDEGGNDQPLFK